MGFLDKLKGAANLVTGGAAQVQIAWEPRVAFPGDSVNVRITATSKGSDVKVGAVWVDLHGSEVARLPKGTVTNVERDVDFLRLTTDQKFKLAEGLVIAGGQTHVFEGSFQVPLGAQPSLDGQFIDHRWEIRGRLETFGNDPDSGFQPFKIGSRA